MERATGGKHTLGQVRLGILRDDGDVSLFLLVQRRQAGAVCSPSRASPCLQANGPPAETHAVFRLARIHSILKVSQTAAVPSHAE